MVLSYVTVLAYHLFSVRPETPTIISSTSAIIKENSNLRLTCSEEVHAFNVTFTFLKDSMLISSGSNNVLNLNKVTTSDSGKYSCKATLFEVESPESEIIIVTVEGKRITPV